MASYKSKKTTIEDVDFEVFALGAWEGQELLVKLGGVLGPALSSESSAQAIAQLAMSLSPADLKSITTKLADNTHVKMGSGYDKLSSSYDVVFSGRYELMLKWLAFALEVNFGSFLGGIQGVMEYVAQLGKAHPKAA